VLFFTQALKLAFWFARIKVKNQRVVTKYMQKTIHCTPPHGFASQITPQGALPKVIFKKNIKCFRRKHLQDCR
jgi:hypothetical protein